MKKILVPCDFSTPAVHAYSFACQMAKEAQGEVFVMHAFELPFSYESTFGVQPYIFDMELLKSIEDKAEENFNKMRKAVGKAAENQHFEALYGSITGSILDQIREKNIDLVVMGTTGASGLSEVLIGSNTEKVVRFSPVPVLSLREGHEASDIKNIVLANSLELNQRKFVEKVKDLQAFFGAKLHILYINSLARFKPEEEAQLLLEDFVKHYKLENYTLNIRNAPFEEEGIIRFVEQTKADMLAMATHSRRGLAHLVSGSLAEDIVNHIDCPIWTCTLRD
ncbi:MAG: universal stress protein [Imperialibacter sp.]|uniref:universal stress protein n=1 Tax=Imperialibacter sp. TaxID=2038411 RepID=UPI0032EBEE9C